MRVAVGILILGHRQEGWCGRAHAAAGGVEIAWELKVHVVGKAAEEVGPK
jgi:hypothetical protein